MLKTWIIILLVILNWVKINAQNCSITASTNLVCLNNALSFKCNFDTTLTPSKFDWDFGNGITSNQSNPTYNFPLVGKYIPTLKITFTNNSQCLINGPEINVVPLPNAKFHILSKHLQCFNYNSVFISDSSTPSISLSPIIRRTFLWGDGGFDTTLNFNDTIYNNYKNTLGGTYSLILEVTDSNKCLTRFELKNSIQILPKPPPLSFTNYTVRCDSTIQTFVNTSSINLSNVTKFIWNYGNGISDSSNLFWSSFNYTYPLAGDYKSSLIVTDKDGCVDTARLFSRVAKKILDNKILITTNNACFSKQSFAFNYKDAKLNDFIFWKLYSPYNELLDSVFNFYYGINIGADSTKSFEPGRYKIQMEAYYGSNCKIKLDTFIDIYGPNTNISSFVNQYQCNTSDTVYFRFPTPEASVFYKNLSATFLWDFDDNFAPPCTTDTKRGINIGFNCKYSKDSFYVKHKFDNSIIKCYNVKLLITDSVRKCSDIDSAFVILTSPNAKPNLPSRRGLYYYTSPPGAGKPPLNCTNSLFIFNYRETLPTCGREKVWINFDSTADALKWVALNPLIDITTHTYNQTADPKGWVTVGLIIKNGECYDTAWYHHMFQIKKLNADFNIKKQTQCAPYYIKIALKDSIQDSIDYVKFKVVKYTNKPYQEWQIYDTIQTLSNNDSIILPKTINLDKGGLFKIIVNIKNKIGCVDEVEKKFEIGFYKNEVQQKNVLCLKDSTLFLDKFEYFKTETNNWGIEERAKANLERIWWNFGDTNIFTYNGVSPKHKYAKAGQYQISLIGQDSLGCHDTLNNYYTVNVVNLKAGIKPISSNLICAPKIIPFYDNSIVIDSLGNWSKFDTIISFKWNFGDSSEISLLPNPVHDYKNNNTYLVKHYVYSLAGCIDSVDMPFTILGPKPKYAFLSGDTIGCSPVNLKINNITGAQLNNWQWIVTGPNNFIYSTNKDSTTGFSLVKAGKYRILLLGTDSLVNQITGQTVYCTALYPDTLNNFQRPVFVTVFNKPSIKLFGPDTICLDEPFQIIAKADTIYNQFLWEVSNGYSSGLKLRVDSIFNYTIKDSGSFNITLTPKTLAPILCLDTGIHKVYINSVKADFEIDDSKSPLFYFKNKSTNAAKYYWNFGQPNSGDSNYSNLENPFHNYKLLNDSFKICLAVSNSTGCLDTMCKYLLPNFRFINIPNVFTPNNDGINDAFDIDIYGEATYEIQIFNRWGTKVFEGNSDGYKNDGINWNGQSNNNGGSIIEGVYFYIFNYSFNKNESKKAIQGTVTLIRE
jgi:gliding motility-associated-like protein